jgi:hypothetical protein
VQLNGKLRRVLYALDRQAVRAPASGDGGEVHRLGVGFSADRRAPEVEHRRLRILPHLPQLGKPIDKPHLRCLGRSLREDRAVSRHTRSSAALHVPDLQCLRNTLRLAPPRNLLLPSS